MATGSHLDRPGRAIQASGGTSPDPGRGTATRVGKGLIYFWGNKNGSLFNILVYGVFSESAYFYDLSVRFESFLGSLYFLP